jgi:hypothetical protein
MTSDSLQVDIGDPTDVRAKLPKAEAILQVKESRERDASAQAQAWRARVELFRTIAGEATPEQDADASDERPRSGQPIPVDFGDVETPLDAAVRTLNELNRPARAKEVADLLRESGKFVDLSNDTVSNALYYAAERAEPRRVAKLDKRGWYAPLAVLAGPDPTSRPANEPFAGVAIGSGTGPGTGSFQRAASHLIRAAESASASVRES